MTTAALIVAAGMSSRMGDFKPMLNIGSISIAQRVVATFRQAGVEKIVMITGFHATMLERHLSDNGIVFLRNEHYETTQMFDSVCIGLRYLKDKCDRVLFTPVDIPLFTASTVHTLMKTDAELACPAVGGEPGHPTLIASALFDRILKDPGDQGLRGALERCGTEIFLVPVSDRGILHDADTPEDYRALLKYHNEQLVRPMIQVSLAREKVFFDSRAAMLFRLINETQSVRTACQRMQMSYSSGWNTIRTLEGQMSRTLVRRSQGGAGGGKSSLTEDGQRLLSRYDAYSAALREEAKKRFEEFFGDLF
ncbi:MAG: NTP transferase domain-containing protein [Oscillospiraceae bacterium]|nr:NTP transferase domain-containing protein [Oscillospiraceae bacterium]